MTLLTIIVAIILCALSALALILKRIAERRARRAEHKRKNNLPAIHLSTARAVINLNADNDGTNKRAARLLAEMAGWRVSDVVEVFRGRYCLPVDELGTLWSSAETKVAEQLEDNLSDDQIKNIVEALYTAPPKN